MADDIGFDPAAWSINGARIAGDLMRVLAYASTGGAEGVVTSGDLKVRALSTPGSGVTIDTGALIIKNKSAGVENQSYVANNRRLTRLDTADTTSAGARSDLVIVRIEDPDYSPWSKPSATEAPNYQYVRPMIIQGVPAGTTSFDELSLQVPYSAYALARIDRPANTGTVTSAHIVNLRKVARPRREPFMERYDIAYSPNDSGTASNTWAKYPDVPLATIFCPEWAAKLALRVDITGPQVLNSSIAGFFRFKMTPTTGGGASFYSKTTYVNEQKFGPGERKSYFVSSFVSIPSTARGRTLACNVEWFKNGGVGFFRSESDVQVVVDLDFIEAAS